MAGQPNAVGAALDFLKSEREYVEKELRVLCDAFTDRLVAAEAVGHTILKAEDIRAIFSNINDIHVFNRGLYDDMMDLRLQSPHHLLENVGTIMKQRIPYFKLYTQYIKNIKTGMRTLRSTRSKTSKFRQFCEIGEKATGKKLKTLMSAPSARLPQYLLMLAKCYELHPDKSSVAAIEIHDAIVDIQKVTDEISEAVRDASRRALVFTIQSKMFSNKVTLVTPNRFVHKRGELTLVYRRGGFNKKAKDKPYQFIVFNDCLAYGLRPERFGKGHLEAVFSLNAVKVEEQATTKEYPKNFQLRIMSPSANLVVSARSADIQQKWLVAIREALIDAQFSPFTTNPIGLEKRIRKQPVSGEEALESHAVTDKAQKRKIMAFLKIRKKYALDPNVKEPNSKAKAEVETMSFDNEEPVAATPARSKPRAIRAPSVMTSSISFSQPQAGGSASAYATPTTTTGTAGAAAPTAAAPKPKSNWEAVWDEHEQATYYWNNVTDECVWEMPDELKEPEPAPAAPAAGPPPPGGPPPPPAAGPPPPAAPPPAPLAGGGGRANLLAGIRAGTTLNKASDRPAAAAAAPSGRGGLLESIRAGKTLKKASDRVVAPKEESKGTDMQSMLSNTLAAYRQFVEEDDDAGSGDEWEDD